MTTYLTESNFITVDLGALINGQKSQTPEKPDTSGGKEKSGGTEPASSRKSKQPVKDWAKELERRLAKNKKLGSEARKSDNEIEDQFWYDFFTSTFEDKAVVDALMQIDLLKKDTKILGFKKEQNPLLAFIGLDYVKKELVLTGLINSNTFKAIHNALGFNRVLDTEFYTANDYNILYCKDLYHKPLSTIEDYLEAQAQILSPKVASYDKSMTTRNIQIFIQPGSKSVKDKNAKLTALAGLVEFGIKVNGKKKPSSSSYDDDYDDDSDDIEDTSKKTDLSSSKELSKFLDRSRENAYALLQYIGMTFNNEKAQAALESVKDINIGNLYKASKETADLIKRYKIDKNTKQLNMLVDTIKRQLT